LRIIDVATVTCTGTLCLQPVHLGNQHGQEVDVEEGDIGEVSDPPPLGSFGGTGKVCDKGAEKGSQGD
jgi:hypothetical protein